MTTPTSFRLKAADFWQLLAIVHARTVAERDAELALIGLQRAKANADTARQRQQDAMIQLAKRYKFDADAPQFGLDDQTLTIQFEGSK